MDETSLVGNSRHYRLGIPAMRIYIFIYKGKIKRIDCCTCISSALHYSGEDLFIPVWRREFGGVYEAEKLESERCFSIIGRALCAYYCVKLRIFTVSFIEACELKPSPKPEAIEPSSNNQTVHLQHNFMYLSVKV